MSLLCSPMRIASWSLRGLLAVLLILPAQGWAQTSEARQLVQVGSAEHPPSTR